MRELVTALRTLTLLPVPGPDTLHFSRALYWFPVVGLLIGAIEAGFGYLIMFTGWPEVAAATVLLAGIAVTRGIHVDGFADTFDGFFGGRSAEERLRIMKDPAVGSFGAIALILLFLFKWIILEKILLLGLYGWIVSGSMLARMVQVLLASSLPYARAEGGKASGFVEGAGRSHIIFAILSSVSCLLLILNGMLIPAIIAFLSAVACACLAGIVSMRKIGGVSGDVLGASSEITEVTVWAAGVLLSILS